ncbi:SACOL1771 family peroxiredoxin [Staphylococcus sp. 17KM0847]|uniref:SACOL1771 family peroxiredoxin n=1 Tax=Staphylococcus sp. 17KM0847 TaxID=2583989 RepID=UPI0015DCBFDC|nr:SACOL1771 family peroxiredoxin [Staphylococcus sp. 17KM0847]QLK86263.1 SACOL1771 family peroxiredoxin [Staphylococcus sp. 17KM0847]
MIQHHFPVTVKWQGGRDSVGHLDGDTIHHDVSIPDTLGGTGVGTNPDELLVSAAASCMTISLAATLERAKFNPLQINMQSSGEAELHNGKFRMCNINHIAVITLADEIERQKLQQRMDRLLMVADKNCMVSNSLRGNVSININAILQVETID